MTKLDPAVRSQLKDVSLCTAVLSIPMELVFVLLKLWQPTVVLGNVIGGGAAVLNFFLLCVTVQQAVNMQKEDAVKKVRASKSLRMLLMLVLCILGIALLKADVFATVIPLLFPRIALTVRALRDKKNPAKGTEGSDMFEQ